jgi:hypothetical protein
MLSDASFPIESADEEAAPPAPPPVALDDVLDATFLVEPASDTGDATTDGAYGDSDVAGGASTGVAQLRRWDFVPVNYFQQTRALERPPGWPAHGPQDGAAFGALRDSPLSQMIWQSAPPPPASHHPRHGHQHHHHHHHFANGRAGRAAGSAQRAGAYGGGSGGVPPLNL